MRAPTWGQHRRSRWDRDRRSRDFSDGWSALSTMIAGLGVWGGIGLGLDRLLSTWPVLFVVGLFVGLHLAAYIVYVRAVVAEEDRRAP